MCEHGAQTLRSHGVELSVWSRVSCDEGLEWLSAHVLEGILLALCAVQAAVLVPALTHQCSHSQLPNLHPISVRTRLVGVAVAKDKGLLMVTPSNTSRLVK